MVEYVSQTMRAPAKESTLLLCSLAYDPFLEMMTDYTHRVFLLWTRIGRFAGAFFQKLKKGAGCSSLTT